VAEEREEDDALELEVFWRDIRRTKPGAPKREDLNVVVEEGDFAIATSLGNVLVCVKPDGRVAFGPGYTPDKAATLFWEYMGQRRLETEDRIALFQQMDALMVRIGEADLNYEQRVLASREPDLDDHEKARREQVAGVARTSLEMQVHQAIELGRGMALRNRGQSAISEENARGLAAELNQDVPPHRRQ